MAAQAPLVWLGQSVRTTLIAPSHDALAQAPIMASLGDAIHRPRLLETVFANRLRDRLQAKGPLLLDSGGFTNLISGRPSLSVQTVGDIFASCDADFFLSLDLPPTAQCSKRERNRRYGVTLGFFDAIAKRVGLKRLVPIVHGRTVDEIAANAESLRRISTDPPMVCIGGLVPLLRRTGGVRSEPSEAITFIANSLSLIRSVFPSSILHLLGAGAPRTIIAALALGADSVDSIAWRRAAGFGTVFTPGSGERFVTAQPRQRSSSRPQVQAEELASCLCPICEGLPTSERIAALSTGYRARSAHNAWVLLEEAKRFQRAKGSGAGALASHLQSRLPAGWLSAWRAGQS